MIRMELQGVSRATTFPRELSWCVIQLLHAPVTLRALQGKVDNYEKTGKETHTTAQPSTFLG